MSFDSRELRKAFGSFMTGVTVVTAVSETGEKVGFTANSFTSVSVDPPLILVCPAKNLSSFDIFNNCSHFAVNILTEDQQEISNTFASATGDRFADISWLNDDNGVPLIDDTAAHFSCSTHNNVDAGDHIILIGEVKAFDSNDKLGLGYARGGYFSLGMERRAEELSKKKSTIVGAIVEFEGKILFQKTDAGYSLPHINTQDGEGAQEAVSNYLSDNGIDAELGSVFSIYENSAEHRFSTYYHAVGNAETSTGMNLEQYELIPVDQLSNLRFVTPGVQSMMQRYMTEKQNGVFRVYVGNNKSGEIH